MWADQADLAWSMYIKNRGVKRMVDITNLKYYTKDYLEGIDNKIFYGAKCNKCGNVMVPAKVLCTKPGCQSADIELIELKPEGKIAAFTCIGVGTTPFVERGYSIRNPYCVAIVQLDNGEMLSGQLLGDKESKITYDENQDPLIDGKPIKVGSEVMGDYDEYMEKLEGRRHGPDERKRCRLVFRLK